MPQNEILICRQCKVEAHAEIVDGQVVRIACPSCGISVEGDSAREVHRSQAKYLLLKKAQDAFKRAFRKGGSVTHKPGQVRDPGGPFVIGKPNS